MKDCVVFLRNLSYLYDMDKILQLKIYVDGVNDTPFPQGAEEPLEIGAFRYDAKRMGGAPTITASVNYPSCLDNEWTDNVYAEFNGEKYYLKQTPTSSYNNESTMYKHDLELVSERVILDNVYFYDAVVSYEMETESIIGNPPKSPEWQLFGNIDIDIDKEYTTFFARNKNGTALGQFDVLFDEAIRIISGPPIDIKIESATGNVYVHDNYGYLAQLGLHLVFSYISYENDKPVSNGTNVTFFGNIREFAKRLQASLIKCGVDYSVVVDDDVVTAEEKLMSFEDQFFSNVLQEIYKTYEIPYYFDGKVIHIGYSKSDVVTPTFSYGVDNALLSITKNNANYKIVNRATAIGSSDNIPFYYPNNSPKGNIEAVESGQLGVKVLDFDTFANKVDLDGVITYQGQEATVTKVLNSSGNAIASGSHYATSRFTYKGYSEKYRMYITSSANGNVPLTIRPILDFTRYDDDEDTAGVSASGTTTIRIFLDGKLLGKSEVGSSGHTFDLSLPKGSSVLEINLSYAPDYDSSLNWFEGSEGLAWATDSHTGWYYKDEEVELKDLGLAISDGATPRTGDTITQRQNGYIKTSQNLMPYKYRVTRGNERFYNAYNRFYGDEEGGTVHFNNPYVEGHPKEHIFTVEDIKPTIKETEVNGLRIDMFSEFAYDDDDNDETYEDEEGNVYFKHPYFYGKLRVMDFNLFDHAIENQPMTISFTSGDCGACNFEIGVTEEYPQKNPVQVDENGNLRRQNGMVLAGIEGTGQVVTTFQERQQDTSKYEVWIALKKEEETYGILMPQSVHRPKAAGSGNDGDTFVILGINLPESYIINAEKKLEAEIIKYLKENNDEKFTFSIDFSRIYFAENETILNQISENSKIQIIYNNTPYDLYVSSFSYNMSEGDVLPDIRVELDDTLKVSQNALQNAISQVKSELGKVIGSVDVVGIATPYFIRKDADDEANGTVNFKKGIKFGEGGKVEVLDNNSAKLTIEYLEVTKKAAFTSLEIQEKTHVGGQFIISPAAINCGEVEELEDRYRCYFQTMGADGDEIFNQFVAGDQAICQTYNAWGSKYYWRLVTGVGEDYIDLSKTDCDENSDAPSAGDKIIQLGNREDATRQSAQVLSSYGEDAPSFVMYNGINSYTLGGKNVTGIIWNPQTKEPQMYSYGSFFFGDGTTDENGNLIGENFITYQKRDDDTEKSLHIKARVTIGEGSEGLSNLSEWKEAEEDIKDAKQSALESAEEAAEASQAADLARVAAQNAESAASEAQREAEEAKTLAESAASEAEEAATRAGSAEQAANAANQKVQGWIEDGKITYPEIQALRNELAQVNAEKNDIDADVDKYGLGENTAYSAYSTAYNNYSNDLEHKIDNVTADNSVDAGNLGYYQNAYYVARTNILGVIASAAKDVADKAAEEAKAAKEAAELAKQAAEEAKEAAELASQKAEEVTEKIDGDNYFTELEKKSIRNLIAEITECKGTLLERNAMVTLTAKEGNPWYMVTDDSKAEWTDDNGVQHSVSQRDYVGFYSSNMHTSNGTTITQLDVQLQSGCDVGLEIEYVSDAQSFYDYLTLSAKGENVNTGLTTNNTTSDNIGGSTYNHQGEKFTKKYNITQQMSENKRFVQVAYKKNGTTDAGTDSGYFRIKNPHFVDSAGNIRIVELKGSFHKYFLYLMQNGYTDVANDLYDALYSVIDHLNGNGLWTTGSTELEDGVEFRTKLNEYLTAYYSILAVCGFDIMDSKVSDLDYLTMAMKDGKTIQEGGLVMTSLVAVGDTVSTSADVKAFMNGSSFASDTEHGTLLHAMGIPTTITEDGAENIDLETRAKNATTRIYEDGTIVVDIANIGGKLMIDQDGLTYYGADGNVRALMGGKVCNGNASGMFAVPGVNIADKCYLAALVAKGNESNYAMVADGKVSINGELDANVVKTSRIEPSGTYTGLTLNILEEGTIDIPNGTIRGLRPQVDSSVTTLNEYHHTVITSSGTIYLPNKPKDGQEYKIIHTATTSLTIRNNSTSQKNIIDFKNTATASYAISSTDKETIELIYSSQYGYWYANKY